MTMMMITTEKTERSRHMTPASTRRGSGTCYLCGRQIAHLNQAELHLWSCMAQWETHQPPDTPERTLYAHVNVRSQQYHWFELAIRHDATLRQLDQFLRQTWLDHFQDEHLSMFKFGEMMVGTEDLGLQHRNSFRGIDTSFLATFDTSYVRAIWPGCTVLHRYDLGDPTETVITTRGLYRIPDRRPIVAIARNNPLKNQPINSPRAYSSPWARLSHFEHDDLIDPPTAPYVIATKYYLPM